MFQRSDGNTSSLLPTEMSSHGTERDIYSRDTQRSAPEESNHPMKDIKEVPASNKLHEHNYMRVGKP